MTHVRMKREPTSPLWRGKEEPASPVPPPHQGRVGGASRHTTVMPELTVPRRRRRHPINKELPPAIMKVCVHILHYLSGGIYGSASGSRAVISEAVRAARQRAWYDHHRPADRSAFTKTDVAPEWGTSLPRGRSTALSPPPWRPPGTATALRVSSPRSARSGRLAAAPATQAGARPPSVLRRCHQQWPRRPTAPDNRRRAGSSGSSRHPRALPPLEGRRWRCGRTGWPCVRGGRPVYGLGFIFRVSS